jgi:hypothetical protein
MPQIVPTRPMMIAFVGALAATVACDRAGHRGELLEVEAAFTLSVRNDGTGAGVVHSTNQAAIDCGAACEATIAENSTIVLAAVPANGSRFIGWSESCAGTSSCSIAMTADRAVTATFAKLPERVGCAELLPPAPPAPVSIRVSKDPFREQCMPGLSDGSGNLALHLNRDFQPGGSRLFFVGSDGSSVNEVEAWASKLVGDASGFIGASWSGGLEPFSTIDRYDGKGSVLSHVQRPSRLFGEVVEDPLGGMVIVETTDGVRVVAAVAHGADGGLRWRTEAPSGRFLAAAVDQARNTLVVTDASDDPMVRRPVALWIDAGGRAGPSFEIPVPVTLSPRLGDGFFVAEVTSSGVVWIGQLDAMGTTLLPAPGWLTSRPNTYIELVLGDSGYAAVPLPERSASPCEQRIDVIDAGGSFCGALEFPVSPESCATSTIRVGRDGTVIQQLPRELEEQGGWSGRTCTWRWWIGLLK